MGIGIANYTLHENASALTPSCYLQDLFVDGKDNFAALRFPRPTADVAVNNGDRIGFAVGADALRVRGGSTQWQAHAGLRFGTWLAPRATVALGILIGVTW